MKLQNALSKPSIISHRGNLKGPYPHRENHPDYLELALKAGFGIEFDVWFVNGQWALGHDEPLYAVTFSYLMRLGMEMREGYDYRGSPKAWMHLKNLGAVQEMKSIEYYGSCKRSSETMPSYISRNINYFWHQDDDLTITNHGHIWVHPKVETIPMHSAWVVPEVKSKNRASDVQYDYTNPNWTRADYVCVDYPESVRSIFSQLKYSKEFFQQ